MRYVLREINRKRQDRQVVKPHSLSLSIVCDPLIRRYEGGGAESKGALHYREATVVATGLSMDAHTHARILIKIASLDSPCIVLLFSEFYRRG